MRKIVFVILLLAVIVSGGAYYLSRKAPLYLRRAIERSMNKTVRIEAIHYQFPWTFRLEGVSLLEPEGPFLNEPCFEVASVLLDISPLSLSKKQLVLDNLEVRKAQAVIRRKNGRFHHAFSGASTRPGGVLSDDPRPDPSGERSRELPLIIRRLHLEECRIRYADYDASPTGFVTELSRVKANIKDLSFPSGHARVIYRLEGVLLEGRGENGSPVRLEGWTRPSDLESEFSLSIDALYLPYFKPYLSQVMTASVDEGQLGLQAAGRIQEGDFTADADLELKGLLFSSFENGEELFGLKAAEILDFFKSSDGGLKFHVSLEWPIRDASFDRRAAIRRAIEASLKKTLLSNTGRILERALHALSSDGLDGAEGGLEGKLKKVKKLFG